MNTDRTREPVGDEFINPKQLNTSKHLPTTHTAYSITNRSDGSTVSHVSHIVKLTCVKKYKNKDLEVKLAEGMGHFGHLTKMTHPIS